MDHRMHPYVQGLMAKAHLEQLRRESDQYRLASAARRRAARGKARR